MAIALDEFYRDGDLFDALEECDQLARVVGRLRRQGRIPEDAWTRTKQCLTEIQALIETGRSQ